MRAPCWKQSTGYIPEDLQARHVKYVLNQNQIKCLDQQWPDVEWPEIYEYLINSPGVYTRESMKSRKSLEAHNQFTSGWVRDVLHYPVPPHKDIFVFKADIMPTQRINDVCHTPWVAVCCIVKSGQIRAFY